MKEQKHNPTRGMVLDALAAAEAKGLLAREIAAAVGGVTGGTAGNYARQLEKDGLVRSELETHPGYHHIIRRRYWIV